MYRSIEMLLLVGVVGTTLSCQSLPSDPPGTLARRIQAELARGAPDAAAELFDPASSSEQYREEIYPVIYAAAAAAFESGDYADAARYLRFLGDHYDKGSASLEGLVLSLFLARAEVVAPDPSLIEELGRALADYRSRSREAPPWVDLVEAQYRIDRKDDQGARKALAAFRARWEGKPAALSDYVDDLERYLVSRK